MCSLQDVWQIAVGQISWVINSDAEMYFWSKRIMFIVPFLTYNK